MIAAELQLDEVEGWICVGHIVLLEDGRLQAPVDIPDRPGLYQLRFPDGKVYLGKSGDLRRRIGDYLVYYAASGIESEFRINRLCREHKKIEVRLYCGSDKTGAGVLSKSERCQIESRLQALAGDRCLRATPQDRIAFHAAEIIRLTNKLSK